VGMSSGAIQVIDCAQVKVQATLPSTSHSRVLAISHLNKSASQMLVSCEDLYTVFDWKEGVVVDTLAKKGPSHLDVSHDDQYAVEATG